MKSPLTRLVAIFGTAALLGLAQPTPSPAQAGQEPDLSKLVEEISLQQAELVKNQTAMEEKIAAIGEEVRQARLFVSRGGGKK